jgi:hypothetical protein
MIVIGFSRSNNFTGWLIRKATGGRWNHAWIGYTDPIWGGQWVTHAISEGVSVQRAELVKESYDESVCFQVIGGIDVAQGMRETRDYVNKPYDFRAVILNGLLLLLYRLTGVEWFNPIIDHNKASCSEFVALILQRANFTAVQGKDAEEFPPDGIMGLYPIIKEHAGMFNEIDFRAWVKM